MHKMLHSHSIFKIFEKLVFWNVRQKVNWNFWTKLKTSSNWQFTHIDAQGSENSVKRVCHFYGVLSSQWTVCVCPWSFSDPNSVSSDCLSQLEELGKARVHWRTRIQPILLASSQITLLQSIRGHQAVALVKIQCSGMEKKNQIIATYFKVSPFALYIGSGSYKDKYFFFILFLLFPYVLVRLICQINRCSSLLSKLCPHTKVSSFHPGRSSYIKWCHCSYKSKSFPAVVH